MVYGNIIDYYFMYVSDSSSIETMKFDVKYVPFFLSVSDSKIQEEGINSKISHFILLKFLYLSLYFLCKEFVIYCKDCSLKCYFLNLRISYSTAEILNAVLLFKWNISRKTSIKLNDFELFMDTLKNYIWNILGGPLFIENNFELYRLA